jgi:uncharacterized membrane protein
VIIHTLILSAAGRDPGRAFGEMLPWLLLLVGVVIVGGVLIYYVRKWMAGDSTTPAEGFTLQDLRDLHARGELTDEEYQNARTAMIGRVKSTAQSVKLGAAREEPRMMDE